MHFSVPQFPHLSQTVQGIERFTERGSVWEFLALHSASSPRGNQWLSLWLLFPGLPGDSHLPAQIHPLPQALGSVPRPVPQCSTTSPALLPVVYIQSRLPIKERRALRRHFISEVVNSTLDFQKKLTHLSNNLF